MKTKPTRKFTPEEKMKCIKEYFNENISQQEITRRYAVPNSTFRKGLGFYENSRTNSIMCGDYIVSLIKVKNNIF